MSAWFTDGTIFALILAITVVEGLVLVVWNRRTGRGLVAFDVVFHLAAGAFLLLAGLLALRGAWFGWIGLAFAAAGLSHGIDLWRRLHR